MRPLLFLVVYAVNRGDEIRPTYMHDESCQKTVPGAITAFLEGESFEGVIRTGDSLGGDTDTLCAICGAMVSTYYGIPQNLKLKVMSTLSDEMIYVIERFKCSI